MYVAWIKQQESRFKPGGCARDQVQLLKERLRAYSQDSWPHGSFLTGKIPLLHQQPKHWLSSCFQLTKEGCSGLFLVMETACFKALGRKQKLSFRCCSSLLTVQSRNQGKRPPASERVVNWWRLVFLRLVCLPVSAVGSKHPKGSTPVLQQSYRRGSRRRAHQLAHLENNGEACWPFGTLQSSN